MSFYRFINLLFIEFMVVSSWAQEYGYKYISPQFELEHINLKNKEDFGSIGDIEEDKEGYIWLATDAGLSVYDGNKLTVYKNNDVKYFLRNEANTKSIYSLLSTKDSSFWFQEFITHVSLFDPVKRKVLETITPEMLNNEQIQNLQSGNNGSLYIKSVNYQKNTSTIWHKPKNRGLEAIIKLNKDEAIKNFRYELIGQNHWIIEENTLTRISIDGKTKESFAFSCNVYSYIKWQDKEDFYYYNKEHHTIYKWHEKNHSFDTYFKIPSSLIEKGKYFFLRENDLFIGDNLSLFYVILDDKTIQDLSNHFVTKVKKDSPNSLGASFVKYFMRSDGSILLCNQKDLYQLKPKIPDSKNYLSIVKAENKTIPLLSFRAITEDDNNNVYASYYTGISQKLVGSDQFIPFDIPTSIKGDVSATYSLHYWKGHLIWNNIDFDLKTRKYTYIFNDKYGQHCTQYLQNDTLWAFQWYTSQLHTYDLRDKKLTTHELDMRVSRYGGFLNEMNDMTSNGKSNVLWISTTNEGISKITKAGKLIRKFPAKDLGISDDNVTDLEWIGDQIWFGCKDGLGVMHIPTNRTTIYKNPTVNANGILQNRMVYSILPDNNGHLFLGTNLGLVKFNLQSKEFLNLISGHPLNNIEFNRASAFKSKTGRFYMGTTDGLYTFTSEELDFVKNSNVIRPIKLLAITIFNNYTKTKKYYTSNLENLKSLNLGPYDDYIVVEWSLPEFSRPIYYSYRLKGQTDIWSEFKKDDRIELNGILPGKYVLEIKASSAFMNSESSYLSLSIIKSQLWYKKDWVIALFLILIIALIFAILRNRYNQKLNRQKELEALRDKISSDLHDDVGSILSGLSMQTQILALNAEGDQKDDLISINDMSKDAMERMRDTVWAIDSRKDKYANLIDRIRAFAEQQLHMKNINHEITIEGINTDEAIAPNIRQNVYLIFKESITNIVKHSNASAVKIKFIRENQKYMLSIRDNGTNKSKLNTDGTGLSNMMLRAKNINGIINIDKSEGYHIILEY